ncbi:15862_t:CDS:2 [Gigaspora rosea]|nr:15862_t:CDS:2 [Gigaspora rosea]
MSSMKAQCHIYNSFIAYDNNMETTNIDYLSLLNINFNVFGTLLLNTASFLLDLSLITNEFILVISQTLKKYKHLVFVPSVSTSAINLQKTVYANTKDTLKKNFMT